MRARTESARDVTDQLVAHAVPEGVVDVLEVVEVEQEESGAHALWRMVELPLEVGEQQRPVRQPGESVVKGFVFATRGEIGAAMHDDDREEDEGQQDR